MAKTTTEQTTTETVPTLAKNFRAARMVSTPLIGISTSDQAATIDMIVDKVMGKEKSPVPILKWDVVKGITPINEMGAKLCVERGWKDQPELTQFPNMALTVAEKLPQGTVLFMINAHLFMSDPNVIQGVWNLRDPYKVNRRTLVLLAPSFRFSPELESDVILLDEPLPSREELEAIIRQMYENAGLEKPAADVVSKAGDAITGLPAFTAEQVVAMSLSKNGIDIDALWERKRKAIEQTPGLTVWRGGERFDDIGGYDNAKQFVQRILSGKRAPQTIVFIDEIEKALAGAGSSGFGDSSGVSQDQLGQLLSYMQDHHARGLIFIGPPGSGKSAIAKCAGNEAGIPTIALDLGGMKGSLVGESEERVRGALKVVTSVSQDQALFIATCNSIGALPPELRRRFKRGTFFFDLPSAEERVEIWGKYVTKFGLDKTDKRPDDEGWTGAEIEQCAEMSDDMGITLREAAEYVVPVSRSAAEQISRLREQASGRFISASKPGVYTFTPKAEPVADAPVVRHGRKMDVN